MIKEVRYIFLLVISPCNTVSSHIDVEKNVVSAWSKWGFKGKFVRKDTYSCQITNDFIPAANVSTRKTFANSKIVAESIKI